MATRGHEQARSAQVRGDRRRGDMRAPHRRLRWPITFAAGRWRRRPWRLRPRPRPGTSRGLRSADPGSSPEPVNQLTGLGAPDRPGPASAAGARTPGEQPEEVSTPRSSSPATAGPQRCSPSWRPGRGGGSVNTLLRHLARRERQQAVEGTGRRGPGRQFATSRPLAGPRLLLEALTTAHWRRGPRLPGRPTT